MKESSKVSCAEPPQNKSPSLSNNPKDLQAAAPQTKRNGFKRRKLPFVCHITNLAINKISPNLLEVEAGCSN